MEAHAAPKGDTFARTCPLFSGCSSRAGVGTWEPTYIVRAFFRFAKHAFQHVTCEIGPQTKPQEAVQGSWQGSGYQRLNPS